MIGVKIFGETAILDDKVERGAGKGMHFIVNGWVLSAQAGFGSYCSQDPMRCNNKLLMNTLRTDCEIALWRDNGFDMIKLDNDTIMGWVKWDMVFDIIEWLRKQKSVPVEEQVRKKVLQLKKNYDLKNE